MTIFPEDNLLGPSNPPETNTIANSPGASVPSVSFRFWGTRGSIASPGPDTVRYGGNTSCVEIQADGTRIILDAGTGIRLLGKEIKKEDGDHQASIFLTHFHWDHIQGLPFFAPAHDPAFTLRVSAPEKDGAGVKALLAGQMGPVHFPLSLDEFPASLLFSEVAEGSWSHENIQMRAMRMRHPSVTFGYRSEALGKSVVYIPDNEIEGGGFPTPEGWREGLREFVRGADVLIHDAMFTDRERPHFEGWGHSTFEQAVGLALKAEVKRLFFFHHAPDRSDAELDHLVERFREGVELRGSDLLIEAAAEGSTVLL